MNKKSHLYHIINPAPWPFFTSIAVFNVLVGFLLFVNKYVIGLNVMLVSFILFLLFVDYWFLDIVRESTYEGKHTRVVQKGLKLGMLLFIVSEVMFFFSFFWGYFHFSLSPAMEIGCIWPPYGIQAFNYLHIPLYNTFVLLLSGVAVTWCHNEIITGGTVNNKKFISLFLTLLLAIHFTYWQVKEYIMSSFNFSDSAYGSIFFMATGFHGFHVILGTTFLTVCFIRLFYIHYNKKNHLGLEFAIWYWHFVDVVWIFLFVVIYYGSKI